MRRALLAVALSIPVLAAAEPWTLPSDALARGTSGKLCALVCGAGDKVALGMELPATGTYRWVSDLGAATASAPVPVGGTLTAPADPGHWALEVTDRADVRRVDGLTLITTVPLSQKRQGRINGYYIGRYDSEGREARGRYAPPKGFLEVTRETAKQKVSEHFRLESFLTHDQEDQWPKYLVLDLKLIDKLECLVKELSVSGLHVMSGYRTPQYNGPGGNGRAINSRHMYGDAADVWVDEDGDGRMDDLNGDGRVDIGDAAVLAAAVERVEQRHPELVGGAGIYAGTREHGPFVHVDARGRAARWRRD